MMLAQLHNQDGSETKNVFDCLFRYHRLALHDESKRYQIYMLEHIHLKLLTVECTMA